MQVPLAVDFKGSTGSTSRPPTLSCTRERSGGGVQGNRKLTHTRKHTYRRGRANSAFGAGWPRPPFCDAADRRPWRLSAAGCVVSAKISETTSSAVFKRVAKDWMWRSRSSDYRDEVKMSRNPKYFMEKPWIWRQCERPTDPPNLGVKYIKPNQIGLKDICIKISNQLH